MRRVLNLLAVAAVLGVAVLAELAAARALKPGDAAARAVLDRVDEVYADCRTYRDTGVVTTVFVQPAGNRTIKKPFTTAFDRPAGRFRFEFTDTMPDDKVVRFIIWREGRDVRTWWDIRPGVETPPSLGRALGGAVGVSGCSSKNVPSLLLPGEIGAALTFLPGAKRVADAKLGPVDCFRVEGRFGNAPRTLWIDQQTYLVRRIDTETNFDTFRTEETTTYDPVLDGEVPDKLLAFDPPERK